MPQLNFNMLATEGPQGVYQGFMQGQQLQNRLAQQEQQRQLGELQLQNALREQRLAGEEEAAYKAAGGNMGQLQTELMQRGLGKQAIAVGAQMSKQRADQMKMFKDTVDLTKNAAQQVLANPQNAAQILSSFGQRYGIDMSDDLAQIQQLGGNPEAIRQWAAGVAVQADKLLPQFETMNLGGGVARQGYNRITGAPIAPANFTENVPLPAAVEAQKSRIAKAGATNVNVSTEKKYGERFGGLIAESDAAKLAAAEKAPEAAATADRVMDLIGTGKVITGTGANARLQIAKALNLAGGTDSEKIRNTEVLVSSLAETTLGAIKSSNLGAGQGFTNADRDFLEKAKAGQLSYDAKSLAELARLSRLAAEKSAESWNTRVKQIPAAALEGTGISTEPVVVQPRKTASVMNIPAGAISALKAGQGTAEQFDAVFGAGSAARVLGKGK